MKTRFLTILLLTCCFAQKTVLFSQVKVATQDSLALVALFDSTTGNFWTKPWIKSSPISTWGGVTTEGGRVTIIDLRDNNLNGKIPTTFGNLSRLQELYLMGNMLSGQLPESIWSISTLRRINLDFNRFSGTLSKSIAQLKQLELLVLSSNQFSGALPAEIGQLTNLSIFRAYDNRFSDTIPSTFANLSKLSEFAVNDNDMTGKLPAFFSTFKNLWQLHLHNNNFSGTIPSSYGDIINLKELYLGNNPQLTGTIPTSFGNLSKLDILGISSTKISGTIPSTFSKLNALQTLYLNDNPNLGGAIPAELGNLRSLKNLDLSGCNFSGAIPPSFSNLSLVNLGLCSNNLDDIPPLNGSNIENICISNNRFTFDDFINAFSGLTSKLKQIKFSPQALFFTDTTITKKTGEALMIDLKIDPSVTNSTYKWYKSPNFNSPWRIIKGSNKMTINSLQAIDAGTYYVEVSNPIVDTNTFSLESRQITIVVQNAIDTSSCRYKDSLELIKIYKATNGPNWKNKWDTLQPINKWYGVETNAQGCVTCLVLDGNSVESCRTWRATAQGNGLNGSLPTLDNGLKSLEYLNLNGNNSLKGTLPGNIHKLESLIALWMYKCGIIGPIPANFWKMPALVGFDLSYNPLNTTLDAAIGTMPKLRGLSCISCGLQGSIPNALGSKKEITEIILDNNQFSTLPNNFSELISLGKVGLSSNKLTTLPNFSMIPFKPSAAGETTFFRVEKNQLTFKDILPNLPLKSKVVSFSYAPQDSIYKDTSITILSGKSLKIPLRIDRGITDNVYTWAKNGQAYQTITGNDTLTFATIQVEDAGTYQVVVSNPRAPDLKLHGRKIRISVILDTNSCSYRDRRELLKLYDSTNGATWLNKWDLSKPMNTWFGVRVNTQGCVTCLDLDGVDDCQLSPTATGNGLTGQLPGLSFNDLESFNTFRNTELGGTIPNFSMPNLRFLLLSSNNLLGSIPLFNMPKLEHLALAGNKLSGPIPNFSYPNLKYLSLNSNELNKQIPALNLPELVDLTLFYNNLEGTIPNLNLPKLERLRINNNQLSGAVPNFNFPNLQDLRLHGNGQLSSLPQFNQLSKMGSDTDTHDSLTLANNQFTFKDIIPNITLINKMKGRIRYAPQAPFYKDTTFTQTVGQSLTINLKIDSTIIDNSYKWYRVGSMDTLILTTNKRTFNSLKVEDSGTYYVQVRNPQAPQLTLYSRTIQINVSDVGVLKSEAINQTSCSNGPISLNFNSGIAYAADNEFRVELSESTTNFNNAINIGTLRSSKAQAISITLPVNYSTQKNYYYRIVSSNPKVVGNISSFKINLEKALPAPIIKCAQSTGNSITFSWEAVAGATGYQVRSLNGGGNGIRNGNSITFSNLTSNSSISLEVGSQGASSCPIALDTQSCVTLNCSEIVRAGQAEPALFICDNQSAPIILNDRLRNEDPNGLWSTNSVLNPAAFDAEAGILQPQELKAGRYRFTYTVTGKNGCPSSAQNIEIVVGQKPKINQQEYPTCLNANGKVQIQLSVVARSINQQYAASIIWFRDPNKKDTLKQTSLELAAPLTIYAQVGQGACASSLSPILLRPQPKLPVPKIEGRTTIKVGDTILLRTDQKYPAQSMFYWQITQDKKHEQFRTIAQGRDLYALPPIIAAKSDVGRYFLLVDDPDQKPSCVSERAFIDVEVKSETEPLLKIGKLASKSSPWVIEGLGQYPQYQIQVFNRWGERVFQANGNYHERWEGTYNGRQLPQGTYYYQIDIPGLEPMLGAVYVL